MYLKLWMAIIGVIGMAVNNLVPDGGMSSMDWATLATQAGTAFLVWYVANRDDSVFAKGVVAAWQAGIVVFMSVFSDGMMSATEWYQVAVAAVSAALVILVPNANTPAPARPVAA